MNVIDGFTTIAENEVGYEETGVNITKYNEWADNHSIWFTQVQGLAWCASFVAWCIHELMPDFLWQPDTFCLDDRCCWSDHWMANFKEAGRFYNMPNAGDLAFKKNHVAIVVEVHPTTESVIVVEGNKSDCVELSSYSWRYWLGYGRPKWDNVLLQPIQKPETTSAKEFVINQGIYIGRKDGEMHWEDNLTREEMALILYRYWKKFNK